MKTPKIQKTQQAMYAAIARAQFLPEPGTPGASGFGYLATLTTYVSDGQGKAGDRRSLIDNEHGVEVQERLERDVQEDEDVEERKVEARGDRWAAKKLEMEAVGAEARLEGLRLGAIKHGGGDGAGGRAGPDARLQGRTGNASVVGGHAAVIGEADDAYGPRGGLAASPGSGPGCRRFAGDGVAHGRGRAG